MTVQVVVPARDEAEHIADVLSMLGAIPDVAVTVVDNASRDSTARIADAFGATVLKEQRIGKGFAAVAGIRAASAGRVFLCDADVKGLEPASLVDLIDLATRSEAPVSRLAIGRGPEDAPVTTLTARPLLSALGLDGITEPLGGLMLLERDFVLSQHLPGGWGFDVGLTLAGVRSAGTVPELRAFGITHRRKPLAAYSAMAHEVAAAVLTGEGFTHWDHRDCTYCTALAAVEREPGISIGRAE
jgi:glucosyl-3-phosphoglycerate synthase